MCNRNATASWSGYSHQGQVGLLVALRTMQESGINLETHFVQFETHEDVAIYEDIPGTRVYKTVHQVKAYYSEGNQNKSKYSSVLNDYFEDGNKKFLHTAVEIIDWDTSATTNDNNVLRYEYTPTQSHCGTTEIEIFIKLELNNILNENDAVVNEAYHRLIFELDHRIRTEHQKKHKHLFDIKFCLSEIDNLIKSKETFAKKEIFDCRRLFYDTYAEMLKGVDIEQSRVEYLEENIIKQINALSDDDYLLFLQRLNLNETPERLKHTQIAYNGPGLKQVFFKMILKIINVSPKLEENAVKYQIKHEPSRFTLTSIIDEEDDQLTVVKNILTNLNSQNLLWENHSLINRDIEIDLVERNPSINNIPDLERQMDEKKKFMSFTNSKLINKENALKRLNDGGVN
ncbi:ABC-three component system protein [Elizabethkingia anophelis]|uniref:ABC-three component system protein n=1 Tax=Elizabethkingia anophelis TaxID=1117645 RepID=UPI0012B2BF34|nr:ABC-three component system protein [Elizabethkingia anophelis]QGN22326.1 hypothetical protein GJV56_06650 [Elizabethkingia anophelis]QNV08980.1 hypothetical protein EIY88_06630 [Elizabethkingia anophelis]UTF90735.1 hypothetical protein J2N93_06695 [Elizabethkingia anophelis]UTG01605.1 hypothetical protein J2O04_06695 [Elizabethkingia anophelis]UTG05355.1 hypothetical protein J2O03_06695 [Elizabethkingia anophelis]